MNSKPGLGTPDLKVSGDFHASISLKKKGDEFEFESKVSHAKYLEKYANKYGLEPKRHKDFVNETFYPEFIEKIKKELQIL